MRHSAGYGPSRSPTWDRRKRPAPPVREDPMTSQPEIDRRLLLGAAGALGLAGTSALARENKPESRPGGKPAEAAKKLSDTIADFVAGFDVKQVPPLAIERARLAFIDTMAVMLAGSREQGSDLVCEMVRQEGAA